MEKLVVAAIVIAALISTIRYIVTKFRSPKSNCCSGGCGTCNHSANHQQETKS